MARYIHLPACPETRKAGAVVARSSEDSWLRIGGGRTAAEHARLYLSLSLYLSVSARPGMAWPGLAWLVRCDTVMAMPYGEHVCACCARCRALARGPRAGGCAAVWSLAQAVLWAAAPTVSGISDRPNPSVFSLLCQKRSLERGRVVVERWCSRGAAVAPWRAWASDGGAVKGSVRHSLCVMGAACASSGSWCQSSIRTTRHSQRADARTARAREPSNGHQTASGRPSDGGPRRAPKCLQNASLDRGGLGGPWARGRREGEQSRRPDGDWGGPREHSEAAAQRTGRSTPARAAAASQGRARRGDETRCGVGRSGASARAGYCQASQASQASYGPALGALYRSDGDERVYARHAGRSRSSAALSACRIRPPRRGRGGRPRQAATDCDRVRRTACCGRGPAGSSGRAAGGSRAAAEQQQSSRAAGDGDRRPQRPS